MAAIHVHQIFYDDASRSMLDPGFVPLDNSANPRPDWYEFFPILNFLRQHELEEGAWYGFLSPKFGAKTGITSQYLLSLLATHDAQADVALLSTAWDQIAFFENQFEQGELWHPGITQATQQFLDSIGSTVQVNTLVNHSLNSVFSNFIVAKPTYWTKWRSLAEQLWTYAESARPGDPIAAKTNYATATKQTPMKVFVQERLAPIILSTNTFRTVTLDVSANAPIWELLFAPHPATRRVLQACDLLKQRYTQSGDATFLDAFRKLRGTIPLAPGLVLSPKH
ncbi:MAG: hypothetical protein ACK5UX_14635 [Burkholderiales bacterium]